MKLIISDTEQLKECVSVNGDYTFLSIKPYVLPAQRIIARYIGDDLLEELLDAQSITEVGEQTALNNALIELVRLPVANLALLSYAGANNVQISDMGISRATTNNLADAFEWQYEGLRQELAKNAYDGIEDLLRFLERKLDQVPAYTNSEAYKKSAGLLIRSAILFSEYHFIDSSRLVFQSLLPSLRAAQNRRLLPTLGSQLISTLLAADGADNLTDLQAKQLGLAQQALVYATMARALREKVIEVGTKGVTVNGVNTIAYKKPPSEDSLQKSIDHFNDEADAALSELVDLIPAPIQTPTVLVSGVAGDRIVSF